MRQHVAPAVSARLAASLAVALLASPALAGDAAAIDALGFSADGRYFAYEELRRYLGKLAEPDGELRERGEAIRRRPRRTRPRLRGAATTR